MKRTLSRVDGFQHRLSVYWLTIAFFAIVLAYGDGFWVTSVQGAVGAIERNDPPFSRWLRDSTLMLPLFFLAVLAALLLARRWFGNSSSRLVKLGATAFLVMLVSSLVAITEVSASSAYDYRLQTRDLASVHAFHQTINDAPQGATVQTTNGCSALCAEKQLTLRAHLKALKVASIVLLVSNAMLVLWVLALRGDRLWRSPPAPNASSEATVGRGVAGAMLS